MRVKRDFRQVSRETYNAWRKKNPKVKMDYNKFVIIVQSFNEKLIEYMFETGKPIKLPYTMGTVVVNKRLPTRRKIVKEDGTIEYKKRLAIDWKSTHQYGKTIYHTNDHSDGYSFTIKWDRSSSYFPNKNAWIFKSTRASSRLLTHYILQPKYRNLYGTWVK